MKPPIPDRAADPVGDAPLVNLPNALTVLRVLCVPLLAVLLMVDDGARGSARDWAAIVFVLASITDLMDGAIARRYGLVTTFGKVADPIADKALTGVALIGLSLLGDLSWWITGIILFREIGVTILRFWVIEHGVIPASRGGKAKTLAQTVAIFMYLADVSLTWWPTASAVVMGWRSS
jgi:CDP-diacylglycerol--glycerol-3-phosphate 3-phosphatidyltransferase